MTRILVFGFDAAESSQIKRIRSFQDAGYDVLAFTMRRDNMGADFVPPWRNIHLFRVANEQIGKRIAVLLLALVKVGLNRQAFAGVDLIVARNFDMLLLALFGKLLAFRPGIPVVYECLDIHGSFTGSSAKSRVFRAIEWWMLKRIALLVVSSPGFMKRYFEPVQHYTGRWLLLENKIWFAGGLPPRPARSRTVAAGESLVVGWVGSLRCQPSLDILLDAAERMGERVRIRMHGNVHRHVVPDFDRQIAGRTNVTYHGPYAYPTDLADVYGGCDLVWAQDLWQSGANSDWLLPNRIYEASYYGCLSIAVAGTETASKVTRDELGYTVPSASGEALVRLLESLDRAAVAERRAHLLAKDPTLFVSTDADVRTMVDTALGRPAGERARTADAVS